MPPFGTHRLAMILWPGMATGAEGLGGPASQQAGPGDVQTQEKQGLGPAGPWHQPSELPRPALQVWR